MQEITVKKVDFDILTRRKKGALEEDGTIIIDEPTYIYDEKGELIVAIFDFPYCDGIREGLEKIRRNTSTRTDGMLATAKIFGKRPRVTMRSDYCNDASLEKEDVEYAKILQDAGRNITKFYETLHPDKAKIHRKKMEELGDDRKYEESIFTSGIINQNNPLPYHYDAGNLKDCFSGMLTFKGDVSGGFLMVPEYNLQIRTRNGSLIMFDGQKLLYGVSPIVKGKNGYRYTLVFYTMKGLWDCLPPKEELKRVQKKRTELYRRRRNDLKA